MDNTGVSRALDLALEALWFSPQAVFTGLPVPGVHLDLHVPESFVVQQKYSAESVELVHLRLKRQFEIAKEWIGQFSELIKPRKLSGVPDSDFVKFHMTPFDDANLSNVFFQVA